VTDGSGSDRPLASCPDLPVEDLVAWLDGEAAPEDAARIAAHAASCPRCAREAEFLRRTGEFVAALPRRRAAQGFDERVLRAVREPDDDAASAPAAPVIPLRRWSAARRAVAAAAVLVVAVGGWWVATSSSDPARLSTREEEEIARDLYVLAHLDTLNAADEEELATVADDLDAIENATDAEEDGG
jgi:anti-sigma factor RsiW